MSANKPLYTLYSKKYFLASEIVDLLLTILYSSKSK